VHKTRTKIDLIANEARQNTSTDLGPESSMYRGTIASRTSRTKTRDISFEDRSIDSQVEKRLPLQALQKIQEHRLIRFGSI
jgi:hypothetical protein